LWELSVISRCLWLLIAFSCIPIEHALGEHASDGQSNRSRSFAESSPGYGLGSVSSACAVTRPAYGGAPAYGPTYVPPATAAGTPTATPVAAQTPATAATGKTTATDSADDETPPPAADESVAATASAPTKGVATGTASGTNGHSPSANDTMPDVSPTLQHVFKSNCVRCHDPGAKGTPKLFTDEGLPTSPGMAKRIVEVMAGKDLAPGGAMERLIPKLHADLNDEEREAIRDWGHDIGMDSVEIPRVAPKPRAVAEAAPPTWPTPPENLKELTEDKPLRYKKSDILSFDQLADKLEAAKRAGKKPPLVFNIGGTDVAMTADTVQLPSLEPDMDDEKARKAEQLLKYAIDLPDEEVVIYCGCCALEECPYSMYAAWLLRTKYKLSNVRIVDFEGEDSFYRQGKQRWEDAQKRAASR